MAAKQQRFEEQPIERTFTDAMSPPPPEESGAPVQEAPIGTDPAPETGPNMETAPPAAEFFLSCLTSVEQQTFLGFCAMRNLTPDAGILAFLKEKIQRSELNTVATNPFTDEAQAVVDSVKQQMPTQAVTSTFQLGRKPVKACEVCGEPVTVDFLGRMLCQKPACWHAYAGLTPQQPMETASRGNADVNRRLGKLESMMDRIAQSLDKMVGAA